MARQISGTAVALATGGAVLIYAGFRGVNPLKALRDVASGAPPPLKTGGAGLDTTAGQVSGVGAAVGAVLPSLTGSALVAAAARHMNERYSQVRRWEAGYSDCSSFVGKCLKDVGIPPPAFSVCVSYLSWSKAKKISRSQLAAGDLCVNPTHMVLATSANSAIGQQNPRDNVRTGTPEGLMAGTGAFVCLRIGG